MHDNISKNRWLKAQECEKRGLASDNDIKEWLRVRRITWANLMARLQPHIPFTNWNRVLEIGGGATSIFLALKAHDEYAVDPMYEQLFQTHPFLQEVKEYKNVKFIAKPIEEVTLDKKVDAVITINVLDHFGNLQPVVNKIDELLGSSGFMIIIIDCYADSAVRSIIRFFDADAPHIHHFMNEEIIQLFQNYKLIEQDNNIYKLIEDPPFLGQGREIGIHRIDKLFSQMKYDLKIWGKEKDLLFILKFVICYGLALTIATLRHREMPIYPLKKGRLFIFQK